MAKEIEQLVKRAERAFARKDQMRSIYQDAYEFAMPERNPYNSTAPGQRKNNRVFDSIALSGVTRLANRLQKVMFTPQQRWALLRPGRAIPEGDQRDMAATALSNITTIAFDHVKASNADMAINEAMHDLGVGTCALFIENGRRAKKRRNAPLLRFQSVRQDTVAIEEGPWGVVEGVFWRWKGPARLVQRVFDQAKLHADLKKMITESPDDEVTVLCTTAYDDDEDDYEFVAIWETKKHELERRRYRTMPWVIMRWSKAPGEEYGRGPLIQALPDIKTANKVVELVLKNAALAVTGVYTAADDGVINPANIRIAAGEIIAVARNGGTLGPSLAPLPRSGDFQIAQVTLENLHVSIKQMLFDRALPPEQGPVRSASEIIARQRELADDIGAAFGRLISEGVTPMMTRVLDILDEAGEINLPLKLDGAEVEIQAISPLAQAQQLDDIQAITDVLSIFKDSPALQFAIKVDEAAPRVSEKRGVPADLIPNAKERAAIKKQAAQQAMAQQVATSPVAAQIAGKVAGAAADQMRQAA